MELSEVDTKEIRKIMREDFGAELSSQECEEVFGVLVGYFDLLTKVVYKDNLNKLK